MRFHLLVKGTFKEVERALTESGLSGHEAMDHKGRVTCQVKTQDPQEGQKIQKTLNEWFTRKESDMKPDSLTGFPPGTLLFFKELV